MKKLKLDKTVEAKNKKKKEKARKKNKKKKKKKKVNNTAKTSTELSGGNKVGLHSKCLLVKFSQLLN